MEEYIFENTLNSNIVIRIKAYNLSAAMELLESITKDSEDFKRISNKLTYIK